MCAIIEVTTYRWTKITHFGMCAIIEVTAIGGQKSYSMYAIIKVTAYRWVKIML